MEEDRPQGLKLSMLTQPLPPKRPAANPPPQNGKRSARPGSRKVLTNENDEGKGQTNALTVSYVLDALITLPLSVIVLFVLPFLFAAFTDDSGRPASIGLELILAPVVFPAVAMIYTMFAYGIFGNTVGKRAKGLWIEGEDGRPATRSRKLARPLFRWGLLILVYTWVLIFFITVDLFNLGWTWIGGLFLLAEFAVVVGFLAVIISDPVNAGKRQDKRGLIDLATGTSTRWLYQRREIKAGS